LWSRSRRLGLATYIPTSRLGRISRNIVNVSVSGGRHLGLGHLHLVAKTYLRPNCVVHSTLIKRVNFGRHGNASLSQSHQLVRSAFIHVKSVSQVLTSIRYLLVLLSRLQSIKLVL